MAMAGSRVVEVVRGKGCTRLFIGGASSLSLCSLNPVGMQSSPSLSLALSEPTRSDGPFSSLVICVTGLSKEARNQVKVATERLGGDYSTSLHPKCTHLVVQSFSGRKFEHALQHGRKNGLFVVTLGWFVDSVQRKVRLDESLYSVKNIGEHGLPLGELNHLVGLPGSDKSCLPVMAHEDDKSSNSTRQHQLASSRKEHSSNGYVFSNNTIYIDLAMSVEMKQKIIDAAIREGAKLLDHWFIGCHATYVVCEGAAIQRYVGHSNNIVTPLWILKTIKEKRLQRLVHLSSDLAWQVSTVLENVRMSDEGTLTAMVSPVNLNSKGSPRICGEIKGNLETRQKIVDEAKEGVRDRRILRMQSCQVPIHPITPTSLLESICWSISEPTSSARIYMESSWSEVVSEQQTTTFFDAREDRKDSDLSADVLSRTLKESEKREVIFKNHFLTILFPIDRFGELGPSSRTFFSHGGFSCIQVLDYIYNFYQENMSANEIEVALHTDSRHADRLRSVYANTESVKQDFVSFKRVEFLGSRRSFEALKRLNGENKSNIYDLLIRA